ncbi:MAG: TetR/AcrR family transcriptional regulator [Ardenticatenaceae bacterium]
MGFDKSFEHREALFDAALEEFAGKGYDRASINGILKVAGMSKGQFYYHFKNKEGLYFALIDVLIARKRAFLAATMTPDEFEQDIFTIFETQIRHGMAFAQSYPAINRFAESFVKEKGNAIYKKVMSKHNFENDDLMNNLVALAYQKGDFREDLPLAFIQKTIGYLFTHVAEITDMNKAEEFEDNLMYLIAFMKRGLARKDN